MGNYLSALLQILVFTCGPLVVFGLLLSFCRSLFIRLIGTDGRGRMLLSAALAPTTPLRVLGNAIMAILFAHRITDICFLNVRDPDGELGFVERSYNARNPFAVLGHFFYALGPAMLTLAAVFAVCAACFGDVLPQFVGEISALTESGGDVFDYIDATRAVIPSMFARGGAGFILKLIGWLLLLVLCMGVFVSAAELLEGFLGWLLYVVLAAFGAAVLMLFDARAQRIALGALGGFASLVTALYLISLLAMAALLALAGVYRLIRFLSATPESSTAVLPVEDERAPTERR